MKLLVWAISIGNLYFGLRCFLNVIGALQTSKYSGITTALSAVFFLGAGSGALYLSFTRPTQGPALWVGFGPWILGFSVLFLQLLTGRQQ
jgi:hypothetical protein